MKVTGYSRVSKDLIIKELEKELKDKKCFFIAQHGTISATIIDSLRAKLRKADTRYFVAKKSLGRKALERTNIKVLPDNCSYSIASSPILTTPNAGKPTLLLSEICSVSGVSFFVVTAAIG